jgi:CDP-paratose 2-epimerase
MKIEIESGELDQIIDSKNIYPKIGITEWFPKEDYKHVTSTIDDMNSLGLKEIRILISKEEFYSEAAEQWYDWLFRKLSENLKILPCLIIESSSFKIATNGFSENGHTSPEDFLSSIIDRYGNCFDSIELQYKLKENVLQHLSASSFLDLYNQILKASLKAHELGKRIILGGILPDDAYWLRGKNMQNILQHIDVIGITAFPEMDEVNWKGWKLELEKIEDVLKEQNSLAEVWITDTGYSSWRNDEPNQMSKFLNVLKSSVRRFYWYSLYDLSKNNELQPQRRNSHFGMKKINGEQKLLFRMLSLYNLSELEKDVILNQTTRLRNISRKKAILITGGAGFIGTNLANRLLNEGKRVIIYDNLSRKGVENNLKWLLSMHPDLEFMIADVNDVHSLEIAVNEASHVFHFAAQVAVTSSLQLPEHDFRTNSGGTFNLLDIIRLSGNKPSLLFTSTNKVYGDLSGLKLISDKKRYFPVDPEYFKNGIDESYPLNFQSPYGCSKGCADQYVLDYSKFPVLWERYKK